MSKKKKRKTGTMEWASNWIGKIRHFNSRVQLDDATPEQIRRFVDPLLGLMQTHEIHKLYEQMNGLPLIRWKDSIAEIMEG